MEKQFKLAKKTFICEQFITQWIIANFTPSVNNLLTIIPNNHIRLT